MKARRVHRAGKIERLRQRRRARALRSEGRWHAARSVRVVTLDDVLAWYRRHLCRITADPAERRKVLRIVRHLHAHDPALLAAHHLPWMLSTARHLWLRPLHAWRPPPGCQSDRRDSLVRHLLARYPVPEFLLHGLVPTRQEQGRFTLEEGWAVDVLAALGRGVSLRTLAGTAALPTPLTRRMCHDFLSAHRQLRPIVALRHTQIVAGGGDPALLTPLIRGRLGRLHPLHSRTDERFWDRVIRWLCRCPDSATLARGQQDNLLRWIELRGRQGCPIRLSGRSLKAVCREVAQLSTAEERARGGGFASSGFRPLEEGPWSLREILTPGDLHREGEALSHCVWRYRESILRHSSAIWSLRHEGRRAVTVEVDLRRGRLLQARGFANRPCRPDEACVLRRWAAENGLLVG